MSKDSNTKVKKAQPLKRNLRTDYPEVYDFLLKFLKLSSKYNAHHLGEASGYKNDEGIRKYLRMEPEL